MESGGGYHANRSISNEAVGTSLFFVDNEILQEIAPCNIVEEEVQQVEEGQEVTEETEDGENGSIWQGIEEASLVVLLPSDSDVQEARALVPSDAIEVEPQVEDATESASEPTALETENDTLSKYKGDSIKVVKDFMIKPEEKATFRIPLCRMQALPIVRPIIEADVQMLEQEFVNGYRDGDRVMFVGLHNDKNQTLDVTEEIKSKWSSLWSAESQKFDICLASDLNLVNFVGKMFWVWEGNHRFTAWYRQINRVHPNKENWHISPMCICLDTEGRAPMIMNAMSDIKWARENSHVKSNLPAKLHRIRYFGGLELESFRSLISDEDYDACISAKKKNGSWYALTIEVFIGFFYKREISQACDAAALAYIRNTPLHLKNAHNIFKAMANAEAATRKSIRARSFEKFIAVANNDNGDAFFDEINRHYSMNAVADMTIEKLQKIATAGVSKEFKAKWLRWWNSSLTVREGNCFPVEKPLREKTLDLWLSRASFSAQLEEAVDIDFKKMESDENWRIDWEVEGVLQPTAFVDRWRVILYDHAFSFYFKIPSIMKFAKGTKLRDFQDGPQIIHRVIYRYIYEELLEKKAITAASIPTYVVNWVFGEDSKSMYDDDLRELYPRSHLQKAGWYMECQDDFVPSFERTLYESLCEEAPLEIEYVTNEPRLYDKAKDKNKAKANEQATEMENVLDNRKDSNRGRGSKSSKVPNSMPAPKNKPTKSLGTPSGTAGSQATTTCSLRKAAVETPGPDATEVGSPSNHLALPSPSHSETVNTGVALARKREALEKATSATSSESSSTRILIENVDMAALMEHYNTTHERHEVYERIEKFLLEVGARRLHKNFRKSMAHNGIDLIIADVPENLPVKGISVPSYQIPEWNRRSDDYFDDVFTFAERNLHDNGVLMFFHAVDPKCEKYIKSYAKICNFTLERSWMGVNDMLLTSAVTPNDETLLFAIKVLVPTGSKLVVHKPTSKLDSGLVDLERAKMAWNMMREEALSMKDNKVPWRGPREKSVGCMTNLIEILTDKNSIVLDWQCGTGSFVTACRSLERHIVALEKDTEIFEAVLSSMMVAKNASKGKRKHVVLSSGSDDEDDDGPPIKITRRHKDCKGRVRTGGRVLHVDMFASPEKGFDLPTYASALANLHANSPSLPRSCSRHVYKCQLIFVDEEATVGKDTSSDDASSDDTSIDESCSDSSPSQ